jgi:hypothetical protein
MHLSELAARLESLPLSMTIASSNLLFPLIETIHVLAIVLVFGTIMIVDLRLLSIASRQRAASVLINEVLPWTWLAFGVAVISGGLMFISAAVRYSENVAFQCKAVALVLAGLNMVVFHVGAHRNIASWDSEPTLPIAARLAGFLSLSLWISVIAFGRWIGFVD